MKNIGLKLKNTPFPSFSKRKIMLTQLCFLFDEKTKLGKFDSFFFNSFPQILNPFWNGVIVGYLDTEQ